jgi:glycosyltransferase involved in cell wall biosynthesis
MLEILACAKPLVSTNVSGAGTMVRDGQNGFIIRQRDPSAFAEAVLKAARLPRASDISLGIADHYSMKNLAVDLGRLWEPLAEEPDVRVNNHPAAIAAA